MGTRSLTRIFDERDKELVCIYRQMDGYPEGMGMELAELLKSFTLVNGIRMNEKRRVANGYGCLAAQLVKELKDGPGSIYLYPPGTNDVGETYEYHIRPAPKSPAELDSASNPLIWKPSPPMIQVYVIRFRQVKGRYNARKVLMFQCAPDEYEKVLTTYAELAKEEA